MKQKFWNGLVKAVRLTRPFFFEFIIIMMGIMLSLWLNDIRQDSEKHKDERATLLQVLEDLKADSSKVSNNLTDIKEYMEQSMKLIQIKDDSIKAAFPGIYNEVREVVTYVPFEPSKVGYIELTTQGKSGKVADKQLVMDIMGLHEEGYRNITRLTDAHRDFLINKIYDYITKQMPYFGTKNDITEERKTAFVNALHADEFRHMLFFDIVLKQNLEEAYIQTYKVQKILIEEIEKQLNK
ncbi:MAG TPA: hypothetical protein VEC12_11910 [Bacteroidia bacterium]|nr:hypothetical protein [Bacteroidia bacterium]